MSEIEISMVADLKHVVFISYSQKDIDFVNTFAALLQRFGLNVWKDSKDIPIGGNIPKGIYEGIKNSSHFCCIISKSSIQSAWVEEELSYAKMRQLNDRTLQIVPILIDSVSIPDFVSAYRCAHLENRDLSLKNPEFIMVLQAFGVNISTEDIHVVTGKTRLALLEQGHKLKSEVTEFREHCGIFARLDMEAKIAPPDDWGPPYSEMLPPGLELGPTRGERYQWSRDKWKELQSMIKRDRLPESVERLRQLVAQSNLEEFDLWRELNGNLKTITRVFNTILQDDHGVYYKDEFTIDIFGAEFALDRFTATLESWSVFETNQ